jgi:hypothetical protein
MVGEPDSSEHGHDGVESRRAGEVRAREELLRGASSQGTSTDSRPSTAAGDGENKGGGWRVAIRVLLWGESGEIMDHGRLRAYPRNKGEAAAEAPAVGALIHERAPT